MLVGTGKKGEEDGSRGGKERNVVYHETTMKTKMRDDAWDCYYLSYPALLVCLLFIFTLPYVTYLPYLQWGPKSLCV